MENLGVIEPIQEPTAWVSHMVPARNKDGSIRLCIDPVNLNKALLRLHHPIKTIEDILPNMPNAKVFSLQVPLDKELSLLTTFITPIGRYKFLRMPLVIIMKKPIHTATPRIQKMLLKLQRCNINLVYKPGKEVYIADTLSRAYQQADESDYNEYNVINIEVLSNARLYELKQGKIIHPTCWQHLSTKVGQINMMFFQRKHNHTIRSVIHVQ